MSSRLLLVAAFLVFGSLSCTDNVAEVKSPTGPSAAAPKPTASVAAFVITAATSSICRVMVKAHDDAKAAADATPEDADLKTLVDELKEAVDDVCQ